ncbi:hypothetical protein INR49_030984 [Caranx melampygus]|nr:hypothetical protein INR49_030984 [Caranx melampygus]
MAALLHNFTMTSGVFLLLLAALTCGLARAEEQPAEELQVETLVKPETCSVLSAMGDTLQIHYTVRKEQLLPLHRGPVRSERADGAEWGRALTSTAAVNVAPLGSSVSAAYTLAVNVTGKLMDGKVIDSSLSRDPLVVELGKRTVIAGLEQSLVGVCEGQKIKATIPSHLAYGKKGYPPTIPGDAALEFEVEVISLTQQTPWQKMVNDVFPLVCLALVPTLLGLVGLYLYKKANAQKPSKKKVKDKKIKKK